jgi:putative PEP-CTERM system TPR-repeat lipoprotein
MTSRQMAPMRDLGLTMARSKDARLRRLAALATLCSIVLLGGCDAFVSADTRVNRAHEYFEQGEFRPAMAELKKALQRDPEHVDARLALADLNLWLGDLDSAQKELERALAGGASGEEVSLLQTRLLVAQGRFDDLEKLLEQIELPEARRLVLEGKVAAARGDLAAAEQKVRDALRAAPEDPEASFELARLAIGRGEGDTALELADRVKVDPDYRARALMLRGLVFMDRGRYEEAREALAQAQQTGQRLPAQEQLVIATARTEANLALNDIESAERALGGVTRWGGNSLIAHYLRARLAMLKSEYSVAVNECQRILAEQPNHTQAQILLAAAHLAQGSTEQANDVLTRVLARNPENVAARKLLAQVHLRRDRPEEARRVLSAGGVDAQSDADIAWLMGAALMRGGDAARGLEHLERSFEANPENQVRRLELASAYIEAGMPDKASKLLAEGSFDAALESRAKALQVLATISGKPVDQGRREVKELVARHDSDPVLAALAGVYLARSGDRAEARRMLVKAIELDPQAVPPRFALARLEGQMGNFAGAEKQLREIVRLDAKHEPARLALAEIAWRKGERANARKLLEETISADPAAIEARLRLAQLAFLEGNAGRARGLLDQILEVAQNRNAALTAAGRLLARAGFTDEAFARFREASASGWSDAILASAQLHAELGQLKEARNVLENALRSRPDWREANQLLVTYEARGGQVERALERAKKLAKDASPVELHVLEGDLYAMAGDRNRAIAAYQVAQKLQPNGALALKIFNVKRAVDPVGAASELQRWLERAPADATVRGVLATHYEAMGERDRAIKEYDQLLAARRISPVMLNNLAWALHEKGDGRALELAKRAYDAAPHSPEIADTYGWILVQMDKAAAGLDVLERALASAPGNPEIQYHAAVAYAKSGNNARAIELLKQALQSSEASPWRASAEQLLRSISGKS